MRRWGVGVACAGEVPRFDSKVISEVWQASLSQFCVDVYVWIGARICDAQSGCSRGCGRTAVRRACVNALCMRAAHGARNIPCCNATSGLSVWQDAVSRWASVEHMMIAFAPDLTCAFR